MQHAINLILGLILALFHLAIAAIAVIEGVLRSVLTPMGLGHGAENAIMLVFAVLLVVAAIRLFGRILTLLLIVVLALTVLHILLPGIGRSAG
ncbi:hypothetical protein [Lichenicoccus roseus]|uniref:Uncharacterized protein n=1 Tax=Lichenicoccus roseus TaxID=2683649 RepID=A0A5R9JCH2_9PROT|nr:hypothetical protein [Lichenicoccus roseus]TLU74237.1 hypothetical protein FE263_03295 [Lichenicoccus roseus]